jgi:hypothetical protein
MATLHLHIDSAMQQNCHIPSLPPFPPDAQLISDAQDPKSCHSLWELFGDRCIDLQDINRLTSYLREELCSPELETLAPRMWMFTNQSSSNISSLTRQRVKGRHIVVTEEPRLHLVWYHDRIFIKPLPPYMLSHAFWSQHLCSPGGGKEGIELAARGFLRTYSHLIRHGSDLRMAQQDELGLLPGSITWPEWCMFRRAIACISDDDVSRRYHYGELRLTRLNFYGKFFLRKRHFLRTNPQYGEYFAQFYAPLLFLFGVSSIVLSAFQVELGIGALKATRVSGLFTFFRATNYTVLLLLLGLLLSLAGLFMFKLSSEWMHALRVKRRNRIIPAYV